MGNGIFTFEKESYLAPLVGHVSGVETNAGQLFLCRNDRFHWHFATELRAMFTVSTQVGVFRHGCSQPMPKALLEWAQWRARTVKWYHSRGYYEPLADALAARLEVEASPIFRQLQEGAEEKRRAFETARSLAMGDLKVMYVEIGEMPGFGGGIMPLAHSLN